MRKLLDLTSLHLPASTSSRTAGCTRLRVPAVARVPRARVVGVGPRPANSRASRAVRAGADRVRRGVGGGRCALRLAVGRCVGTRCADRPLLLRARTRWQLRDARLAGHRRAPADRAGGDRAVLPRQPARLLLRSACLVVHPTRALRLIWLASPRPVRRSGARSAVAPPRSGSGPRRLAKADAQDASRNSPS